MGKSSKKRERTSEEEVADNHDAAPILKKSKLDSNGSAEVTKKSSKVKEPKTEAVVEEEAKPKKEKKNKKDKKDKKDKSEKKDKKEKKEKKEKAAKVDEMEVDEEEEPKPKKDKSEKKEKNDKKDKKKKSKDTESAEPSTDSASAAPEPTSEANGDAPKSKKDKKKKSKTTTEEEAPETTQPPAEDGEDTTNGAKGTRFICFVGNLPFTATAESIKAHFATVHPTSVRLLTQRDNPSKSRGIAFVEFGRYDHMKTCLEKFHHTEFSDGLSAARKINVELTAGGGGKTAARQDKIKQKNAKLNEERLNRMKKEEQAKLEKANNKTPAQDNKTQEQREEDSIHPSRRARVPYNGGAKGSW